MKGKVLKNKYKQHKISTGDKYLWFFIPVQVGAKGVWIESWYPSEHLLQSSPVYPSLQ